MIEIHNKSTYQRIYNNFSSEFVDYYCVCRQKGLNSRDSILYAKIKMEDRLSFELARNRANQKTVMKAFENVKSDSKLLEKAILYYQRLK